MKVRIPDLIERELEPLKGRWSIAVGSRHLKIIIDNKMVGILPMGGNSGSDMRPALNVRSQIRRHLKGVA